MRLRGRLTAVAAIAAAAALAATLLLSIQALRTFAAANDLVVHTMRVRSALADVLEALLDAETGERGYVITGDPGYLEPYQRALGTLREALRAVRALTADEPRHQVALDAIEREAEVKLAELQQVIAVRQSEGLSAAAALVGTHLGKNLMDALRRELAAMETDENRTLVARQISAAQKASIVIVALVASSVLFGLLVVLLLAWRAAAQAREALLRAENERYEERERTSQFQERFIAVLGHDLRNPLTSFKMGLELLRRTKPEAQGKVLARMGISSARMSRMVEQLLDFTRSRLGGGIPIVRRPADLGAIVRTVVDELAAPNVAVTTGGDLAGVWDPDRLEQVVSNLVSNALGHGVDGESVRIALAGDEGQVVLTVRNGGPAIPDALRERLFDPFRRGERDSKSERTAGLGLGLFISREIVRAHGGTIAVASSDADGTTFTVTLPRGGST